MTALLEQAQADIAAERADIAAERDAFAEVRDAITEEREAARQALVAMEGHARSAAARAAELEAAYHGIAGSRTWRLRTRVVGSPVGRLLRRR